MTKLEDWSERTRAIREELERKMDSLMPGDTKKNKHLFYAEAEEVYRRALPRLQIMKNEFSPILGGQFPSVWGFPKIGWGISMDEHYKLQFLVKYDEVRDTGRIEIKSTVWDEETRSFFCPTNPLQPDLTEEDLDRILEKFLHQFCMYLFHRKKEILEGIG